MRTQTRRRTAVVIALLACAAVSVLWMAITMGPGQSAGLALDGSGSGSVNSGSVGSGAEGSDSARSGSTGSGSAGSEAAGSSATRSGSAGSGSGSGSSVSTGSGSTGSGSDTSGNGAGRDNGSTHGNGSGAAEPGGGTTDSPGHADGLSVSVGSAGTLYPGARSMAPVTIVNQRRGDLAVTHIRVISAGADRCLPGDLVLGNRSLRTPLLVPGYGGRVDTQVRFGLRATAPDSCKGKTLPFSVTVRAVSR
jgi:hypothetical protein